MKALSLFSGIGGKSEETRRKMSESAKKRCTPEWRQKRSELLSTKLDLAKVQELYNSGMTQVEIAAALGVTQKIVWKFMKNNGLSARVAAKRNQSGEQNDCWKGGKSCTNKGYIVVRMPDHPRASPNGYVFEHILVAERMLGRPLEFFGVDDPRSEIVHHKNEKKNDNRPENLEVMTLGDHVKLHNEMRRNGKGGGANAKGEDHASA